MDNENQMTIFLKIGRESFTAETIITCPLDKQYDLSFILNNDLVITSIHSKNGEITWSKTKEISYLFRPVLQKIEVKSDCPLDEICIKYHGSVQFDLEKKKNWHNIITDEFVSLNWYSSWFPQELSIPIGHNKVIFQDSAKWFVLKANFLECENAWVYDPRDAEPYNIIAYDKNKLQIVSNEYMNIYFTDNQIKEQAEKSLQIYMDIIEFYNGNLFDRKTITTLDVPCSYPHIDTGGCYFRKGLVWCVSPGKDDNEIAGLFGHETAHLWCTGANPSSWEDWLNEAMADWALLLFALSRNDMALFYYILNPKIACFDSLPKIKTDDLSRPEGVHDKGTVLLYKIYQKLDYNTMFRIVKCFASLQKKTTENLLKELSAVGLHNAAEMIEAGINESQF